MIAAAVLMVAFRRARDCFWLLLPVAICLILSTIYCRYHYVVDVIPGLVVAVVMVPLADRLHDRLAGRESRTDNRDSVERRGPGNGKRE